ncbi:MAG: primosomal protein N' [Candidatus Eisenbacteria bacterium]|nr:primosomal protein N' [Candidatus Eisenbacteria bacterium]
MSGEPHLADVAVPVAVSTLFTYLIPEEMRGAIVPGQRVAVALGRRRTRGYVVRVHAGPAPERLRPLGGPDPIEPLFAGDILELTRWVSEYYLASWGEVLEAAAPLGPTPRRARRKRAEKPADTQAESCAAGPSEEHPVLAPEQAAIVRSLQEELDRGGFAVHLVHGVAGSGKTEIYMALAARVLDQGGSVLLLEPEIGIATQILARVRRRFGNLVGLYHSQVGARRRRETWEKARRGEIKIVVGARSAVFVPLPDLRLVVIDEEQEPAYKQEESPRYNGRDVAIVRARNAGALAVLGTATPSLEAWWNAKKSKFQVHVLTRRFGDTRPPKLHVVDLRRDPGLPSSGGPIPLFSGCLVQKTLERLRANEQTILFLNRRGHSTMVQCNDCGEMIRCSRCDVVLTYHRVTSDLRCHHCGLVRGKPDACAACGSGRLFYGGVGTQKLEERLAELFPRARLLRMDADATRRRGSHARALAAVESGEVDILLGTQMVAKGLDFPRVTLVGILQADREMALPELRAAERAYQVLTQVAGRAGRREVAGEVVLQTMLPEHYVIRGVAAGDYEGFARAELAHRESLGFPPFARMIHLLFDGRNEERVRQRAEALAADIGSAARRAGIAILGPAPMFLTRLEGRYRWHLTLKGSGSEALHRLARQAMEIKGPAGTRGVRLHMDVDPIRTL